MAGGARALHCIVGKFHSNGVVGGVQYRCRATTGTLEVVTGCNRHRCVSRTVHKKYVKLQICNALRYPE